MKTKEVVWAEIEDAARSFTGATEQQRISGYLRAHPEEHGRYLNAPQAVPADVAPPEPMTMREAEQRLAANQQSPDAIDRYFDAAGRERAAASGGRLSLAQAYAEVVRENPRLHRSYVEGLRAGRR
ncbi:MAG: hypothetical protein KC442_07270 [Thermomicrobiales bacterium]|nr:hypothetical protein [Thermomicrobiales bacterium]